MIRFLEDMQTAVSIFFFVAYAYQIVYLFVGLFSKHKFGNENAALHRYAVIISARNEENVIAGLIASLKKQEYPKELLDIFVVADNCTDHTAAVARRAGAIVYERQNRVKVGKGYALDYLFQRIFSDYGKNTYEAFIIFDADNYVDPRFVAEMNRMFDTGKYTALTSYRNSKNFCANWISAGYALWFLRESRYLNAPRTRLGVNCAISGTGFLVSADVIRQENGWSYHLLTEDIEFSVFSTICGRKIGYCANAITYDEQPVTFRQSWDQRLRWSKGFYQVDVKYMGSLMRGCFSGGRHAMSCYDILMTVAPCNLIIIGVLLVSLCICISMLVYPSFVVYRALRMLGRIVCVAFRGIFFSLLLFGAITMLTEWDNIQGKTYKKIFYVFTFPLFMLTYIPISIAALIGKVEWKPIRHGISQKERA